MNGMAIKVESLKKSFGGKSVLQEVSFQVRHGTIFAFLGRNGEGKTTTIRTMLGQILPDKGHITVDGLDPFRDPLRVRERVGYLAEDQKMFGWMTVAQIIRFVRPFYPKWDDALAKKLLRDFDLPPGIRIQHLSKGQNVRLGLLLALSHHPSVVILDDPTLGLDPIMRKEFMRDVIDHLQGEGATVFFSSHLLYEIEPVADEIAILNNGRIVLQSPTESLRQQVRQFIISLTDYGNIRPMEGLLDLRVSGRQARLISANAEQIRGILSDAEVQAEESGLNLDEIFEAYVIGNRGNGIHA